MSSTNFYLEEGTNYLEDEILIEQPSTQVVLHTEEKYINNDISLNLNIKSGSATTPTTTITTDPSITVSNNGLITASYGRSINITPTVSAGWISSGTAGTVSTSGSNTKQLTTKASETYNTSTSDQTIASGAYLTGNQIIRKVTTSGISAENIKTGTTIRVGDTANSSRIALVTGTFTAPSTVSSGQTAASSSKILNGYSAWVNGAEVQGNIPSRSSTDLVVSGAQIITPAGYYSTEAYKTVNNGSTTQNAPTINSSTGLVTATATVTAGYQAASTKSNTLQLTTQAAQTITPGTTSQTIAAGTYLTGKQTIAGASSLIASNIKAGKTIFGVTGTFTDSSTLSSGQIAASSSEILRGYSAWVDGAEVQGTIDSATGVSF